MTLVSYFLATCGAIVALFGFAVAIGRGFKNDDDFDGMA